MKDLLSALGGAVTVAAALFTIVVALLRTVRSYRAHTLLSAVHRVARHRRTFHWDVEEADRLAAVRFALHVANELLVQLDVTQLTPADAVAEALASWQPKDRKDVVPWRSDATGALLQRASLPRATSLTSRILYPEETPIFRRLLREAGDLLSAVGRCKPIPTSSFRSGESPGKEEFPEFAQWLTGAAILVDATVTRARFAETVHVWHSRAYRGVRDEASDRYDTAHRSGHGCHAWQRQLAIRSAATRPRPARMVGDFDKRVLHLRGATLCEDVREGYLAFVLETSETCYAATEDPGRGFWTAPGAINSSRHVGCKNVLVSERRRKGDPVFRRSSDGSVRRRCPDSGRVGLVNAYVAIVSCDTPPSLALVRRTGRVAHGQNVISASAGGLIDPGAPGPNGDVNTAGQPDPLATIIRECREELGVSLSRERCRPIVVFLANIREQAEELEGEGQLGIAVILYIAITNHTYADLSKTARLADPARGAFKQQGLVACPLSSVEDVAQWTRTHAAELDQHGMLSCVYASAAIFGPAESREAFAKVYVSQPWWVISPYKSNQDRLVRRNANSLINGPFRTVEQRDGPPSTDRSVFTLAWRRWKLRSTSWRRHRLA
jgi:8-oxo-dGTP pyrophosphatase MutT (NUDIX family)